MVNRAGYLISINVKAGLILLVPMLLVEAASVLYWRATEQAGAGNVIPYGVLQVYAVVILVASLYPGRGAPPECDHCPSVANSAMRT